MKAVLMSVDAKGGVAKSTSATVAVEGLSYDGTRSVDIYDGDTSNSTLASMYDDVKMLDFSLPEVAGEIVAGFASPSDFMVVDSGARDERRILSEIMPLIVPYASKQKIAIVALRPITLSSFVQANAVAWVQKTAPMGVKTVFIRVLAQGRTQAHFADWDRTTGRKSAIELGAVEIDLTDAGVRWGDEVPAFGTSFARVAVGDFSRIPGDLQVHAVRIFTPGIQAHLGLWLESNVYQLRSALEKLGLKL